MKGETKLIGKTKYNRKKLKSDSHKKIKQLKKVSRLKHGTRREVANHAKTENLERSVSRVEIETQPDGASHELAETQYINANHLTSENLKGNASHDIDGTQVTSASSTDGVIRFSVEAYYDYQHTRCITQNRLRNMIRRKYLGLQDVEEKKDEEEKSYGKEWTDEQLSELIAQAKKDGKVDDADEQMLNTLLALGKDSRKFEGTYLKKINDYVTSEQIYSDYLSKISGIGPVLAAGLISWLGYCEKFDNVAKLWAYAGLKVVDGHAQKRVKGEKGNWNPRLKTLCWKLGDSFVKSGKGYRSLYDQFHRTYEAREDLKQLHAGMVEEKQKKQKSYKGSMGYKAHIFAMAKRKTVKLFLSHYWLTARKMKGLPLREPYPMEKLGHTTFIAPFTDEVI